ncbi:signal recognition particle subunit SRP72 [Blastomyces silverae]|uniref:Signal recognition particle subunit SRP72 n=1 Tax=Blastomyces silverae TaxID=2060906 RepID=A0A0H1BFQ1_9EURO|nr:signal recognition particle subunit SRP72 [Blastomyces silverae]
MATQRISALLQRSTIDDHEEVIKACNAVLKTSKNDLNALHVKTVALVKLDRFEDAIRVIEDGGDALKKKAPLEWSYALYKVGELEDAIKLAASVGTGRGGKHVEAQATYRAENFRRTAEVYKELSAENPAFVGEQNDLRINSRAADAQLQWSGLASQVQNTRPSREELESFETTYNVACGAIGRGELETGGVLLKRAKELCKSSEDLTPEDKVAELLPIAVQQLYVALKQGKSDEAKNLADEINVAEIPEISTKKIAQNNILLASQAESNPYILHKQFYQIPASTDGDRLFSFQSRPLTGNSYVVDLLVRKFEGIQRSTEKALSQHPAPTTSPNINALSIFNVAANARDGSGKAGLKEVLPLLAKRPNDIGLVLTLIQLYVSAGNVNSAISVLEAFFKRLDQSISESDRDIRFNPGLIGILVSLYKIQGRKSHIKTELSKAASHWQSRSDKSPALLRAAGSSLLTSGEPTDLALAGKIFTELHTTDPNDQFATAGYVSSYAITSPDKVSSAVDKLSPVQDLIADIDVSSLEAAGIPSTTTSILSTASSPATAASGRKRPAADDANKKETTKKRVRKSRLPKDYDPNKKPDPERWLPLRDRSSYRPKGKKGKQRAAERTQGGVVNEKSEESPASTPVIQAKGQVGGNQKKKKMKGKK